MKHSTFFALLATCIVFTVIIALAVLIIPSPTQHQQAQEASQESAITPPQEQIPQQDAFANITIKNLTLKELEKNKTFEVIINAQECKFLHPSDAVECTLVTCTLLDNKAQSALLKTNKALINRAQKTILFSGGIVGIVKDLIIKGSDINYNFSNQILRSDKSVLYQHPDFYLTSQQSFIDLKNNKIDLSGGVINEFSVK